MRNFTLASAMILVAFGFASAEELSGLILKVEDGKVSGKFTKKGAKSAEEMTLPVAKDVKVLRAGQVGADLKKVGFVEVKDGLKNPIFSSIGEKGLLGTIITDDQSKQIKEVRLRFHQPVDKGREKNKEDKKEVRFPPLPRAVSSFGAAVADGWVYVYGGHATKTHEYSTEAVLGKFYRLKLSEPKTWEELPSGMPVQGLALVAHGGKIYRIGGMQPRNKPGARVDNHSVASCTSFDPASKQWKQLPDLPAGRSSHDAVVVNDKIVVVGGWKLNGAGKELEFHETALTLDLKKPLKWQSVPQPFQRRALTAAVLGNKVYVIGGMDADDKIQLTVNIYDVVKGTWSTGPNIPGPRRNGFSPAAIDAGGRLYVSTADGKIWRLSAKEDAWDAIGSLQQPRIVHRLAPASENMLLALGGAFGGDNIAHSEAVPLLPGP